MFPDHPPPGQPHPWTDPFAPPDLFNPRPDAALGMAGPLAPSPEQFPLTDEGKRDYYTAVERTAQMMTMQQHMVMQDAAVSAAEASAARAAASARARKRHLLLLRP